jgi:hypothetical protein
MTENLRSNRLPALAAEIRRAHADVQEAAKTAAQRAIDAGHALIEAKDLLPHGGWLPWLREHCALAERTAQLYMKIARSGIESATVADLGLQAASQAIVGYIDYRSDLNDPELIEWRIFQLFLAQECGFFVENAVMHSEWLRRRSFRTPSEWLLNGACERFWRVRGQTVQPGLAAGWRSFLEENRCRTAEDLDAELNRLATQHPMPMPARQRRRAHVSNCKSASVRSAATRSECGGHPLPPSGVQSFS